MSMAQLGFGFDDLLSAPAAIVDPTFRIGKSAVPIAAALLAIIDRNDGAATSRSPAAATCWRPGT